MIVLPSLTDPRVAALLATGKVGVMPTDTVYGVVAAAHNKAAVTRLYALKKRERKPGTLVAASAGQLVALGLDAQVVTAVEHLWPNAVSVIIPVGADMDYLDQGLGDVAARVPNHVQLRSLLQQVGPLVSSSANQPGQPPANNLAEAQRYFGDEVDFYVDGEDLSGQPPSTIIRMVGSHVEIVRQGAVSIDQSGNVV